ncbi:hypothetical protein F5Y15DRAFT_364821 [Xylariaceae sp. FL0016]|nr:hypothetical protein F5Y15DRAFT_364821 [Xylariaceae sp. FL0016]
MDSHRYYGGQPGSSHRDRRRRHTESASDISSDTTIVPSRSSSLSDASAPNRTRSRESITSGSPRISLRNNFNLRSYPTTSSEYTTPSEYTTASRASYPHAAPPMFRDRSASSLSRSSASTTSGSSYALSSTWSSTSGSTVRSQRHHGNDYALGPYRPPYPPSHSSSLTEWDVIWEEPPHIFAPTPPNYDSRLPTRGDETQLELYREQGCRRSTAPGPSVKMRVSMNTEHGGRTVISFRPSLSSGGTRNHSSDRHERFGRD